MAGLVIFDVESGSIVSARFYLKPVEQLSGGIDDAIGRLTRDAPQGRAQLGRILMSYPPLRLLGSYHSSSQFQPWLKSDRDLLAVRKK